jgi:hypothetical protein
VPAALAAKRVEALVQLVSDRLGVSRRDRERLLEVLRVQPRLLNPGRRGRGGGLVKRDFFSDALRLLELSHRATGQHEEELARWTAAYDGEGSGTGRRRRRRRRRAGSRRSPPADEMPQAEGDVAQA